MRLDRGNAITAGILLSIIILTALTWVLCSILLKPWPLLLSQCLLAYTIGLRHAFDADHIAVIDNATRRLVDDWRRSASPSSTAAIPQSAGLFFSLGHSTVVIVACGLAMLVASVTQDQLETYGETLGLVGSIFSIVVLSLLSLTSFIVFWRLLREYRAYKQECATESNIPILNEDSIDEEYGITLSKSIDTDTTPKNQTTSSIFSCWLRVARGLMNTVDRSWKLFPIGLLLGIGFDTSLEICFLAIAALKLSIPTDPSTPSEPLLPIAYVFFLPLLFTLGMCLLDTIDGMMMARMYAWAYRRDTGKRYIVNLTITLGSVLFGVLIAIIQLMSLLAEELQLEGAFWQFWITISESSEWIGAGIACAFLCSWALAYCYVKYKIK